MASDKNGRKIKCFHYRSSVSNAPVIINIYGSGLDGTFEKTVNKSACEDLVVRGISISLLGIENTDIKIRTESS